MSDYNYCTSYYLGKTTKGFQSPVFFDLHSSVANNKPPTILTTGGPGTGKSFLTSTIAAFSAISAKSTVVLDYKGELIHLANLGHLFDKRVNLINITDTRKRGVLDPFNMVESRNDKLSLSLTVIDMFLGGLSDAQRTVLAPVLQDVIDEPVPSLSRVTEVLSMSPNPRARDLGTQLSLISKLQYAGLCFAPGVKKQKVLSFDESLTVIVAAGLELPQVGKGLKQMTNKERLASAVFYLITDYVYRLADQTADRKPKTVIIDEAWAVASTEAGAEVIKNLALLGRSRNLALMLTTQSKSHLENLNIDNTISVFFAFRTDHKEAESLVRAMQLPENEGFEEILLNLDQGECLMRDFEGRFATIKVDVPNEWMDVFETNPAKMARRAARGRNTVQ